MCQYELAAPPGLCPASGLVVVCARGAWLGRWPSWRVTMASLPCAPSGIGMIARRQRILALSRNT
jgi:hypothetical protein